MGNQRHNHKLIMVNISYVSKENNLGPGEKIKCILGLEGLIFILQAQLI